MDYTIKFPMDKLYEYQKNAIQNWKNSNYRGIFDMCTGAGKTFTAIGGIKTLYEEKGKLAVVIVVPYIHLVEQWLEDLVKYNINPVVGYSSSKHRDYKRILKHEIFKYNHSDEKLFCFITTNMSFSTEQVQKILFRIQGDKLIVVDEAHNFGADRLSKTLSEDFTYRLALSATLDRHNDIEGTERLYSYFGEKVISYTLEEAIKDEKLTPYYYYPHVVYLLEDELEKYQELSEKIKKEVIVEKDGKIKLTKKGEILSMERARIVSGAFAKVGALKKEIEPFKNDNHILVYCGSTTYQDVQLDNDCSDIRQIDYITKVLGEDLGMTVIKFTSQEDINTRELIKKEFTLGTDLQGIIAIKCLDEGVNIPNIKTAFILASTTNPKEYIQRRGRVLRRASGKNHAIIHDFVTLPRQLDLVDSLEEDEVRNDVSLVKNELLRIREFKRISQNPLESDMLISEICDAYNLLETEDGFKIL